MSWILTWTPSFSVARLDVVWVGLVFGSVLNIESLLNHVISNGFGLNCLLDNGCK